MCEDRRVRLEEIAKQIMECVKCPLHRTRTRAVPGEGDPCATVMLVGEAPGYNEDIQGRPFVGAAGKLLNQLLGIAGFSRSEVFITNVVKCRPPNNRDPREEEVEACKPYLIAQLEVLEPKVVVSLGNHSSRLFFKLSGLRFTSIMRVRGVARRISLAGRELLLLPTLHPAAALYNPRLRALLEKDFQLLGRLVSRGLGGLERWLDGE